MHFTRNTLSKWEIIFIVTWGSNTKCIANLWIHTVTKSHMLTKDRCNNLKWRPKKLRLNAMVNWIIHGSDQGDFQKLPMHFVRHVCEYQSGQNHIIICYKSSKSTYKMLGCFFFQFPFIQRPKPQYHESNHILFKHHCFQFS